MKTKRYMIMILDRNKTFIPTLCILDLEKRAIKHKGSKLWNDLSDNLKDTMFLYTEIKKKFLQLS